MRFKKIFDKTWKIIVAIGTLIGLLGGIIGLIIYFESSAKKFKEETSIEGDLKPNPIPNSSNYTPTNPENFKIVYSDKMPNYVFQNRKDSLPEIKGILLRNLNPTVPILMSIGSRSAFAYSFQFNKGIDFFKSVGLDCNNAKLIFGIKDNRLYVSTEFKQLKNEETMGIIEYNHWVLYKENILRFYSNDTMLEVRDKENKIAFTLRYVQTVYKNRQNYCGVYFGGYFLGDTSVTIINPTKIGKYTDTCISKSHDNWKQVVSILASQIGSVSGINYISSDRYQKFLADL